MEAFSPGEEQQCKDSLEGEEHFHFTGQVDHDSTVQEEEQEEEQEEGEVEVVRTRIRHQHHSHIICEQIASYIEKRKGHGRMTRVI